MKTIRQVGQTFLVVGGAAAIGAMIPLYLGSYPPFFCSVVFAIFAAIPAAIVWGLIRSGKSLSGTSDAPDSGDTSRSDPP